MLESESNQYCDIHASRSGKLSQKQPGKIHKFTNTGCFLFTQRSLSELLSNLPPPKLAPQASFRTRKDVLKRSTFNKTTHPSKFSTMLKNQPPSPKKGACVEKILQHLTIFTQTPGINQVFINFYRNS
jgi:hypothetical protein